MCVCGGGGWSRRVGAGGAHFSTGPEQTQDNRVCYSLLFGVFPAFKRTYRIWHKKKILRRRPLDLYSRLPIFARLVHLNDLKRSPQQKLCDATFSPGAYVVKMGSREHEC